MKKRLPGRVIIEERKLTEYCLNPSHPLGKHKARVFKAAVGMTRRHSASLLSALNAAAAGNPAHPLGMDEFGQRYSVDFALQGPTGWAWVRSLWIVKAGLRPLPHLLYTKEEVMPCLKKSRF